jgi:uncharacterized protein YbjQ (UPF0145 family)
MFEFRCDSCRALIRADESLEGQRVICRNCNTRQTVPAKPAEPPPAPAPFNASKRSIASPMITTGEEIAGYQVSAHLGIVRGVGIRSTGFLRNPRLSGVKTADYADICETARDQAHHLMLEHARRLGANAILALRYDSAEVSPGVTEVVAYGTAVKIAPAPKPPRKTAAR